MRADNHQCPEGRFPETEKARRYRVPKYRLALVREATIATDWDKTVRESGDVAWFMAPVVAEVDRETFWVVMLDGKNRVIGVNLVSVGSLTAALVHPRGVFKAVMVSNGAAVVLVHNYPSGDPTPSPEDLALTKRLCEVGDLVGIRVLDHIVLGDGGTFRSLADDGVLGGPQGRAEPLRRLRPTPGRCEARAVREEGER